MRHLVAMAAVAFAEPPGCNDDGDTKYETCGDKATQGRVSSRASLMLCHVIGTLPTSALITKQTKLAGSEFHQRIQELSLHACVHRQQGNHKENRMRKVAIGIAAAIALAAVTPARAQGVWIGVPGFGIGIGTGPTYAYGDPYYGGYRYGPPYTSEGYVYEPGYEYDSYAYVPNSGYAVDSYGPGVTYGYRSTDSYRYAPRARYLHNYAYSPEGRTTRGYPYGDTRRVINRDRGQRAGMVPNAEVRDGAVTRNHSVVGTERESATSRRIRSGEASKAMARGQDSRQSKSLETGKTKTSRPQY
jgi:hypothetical protein